MRRAPPLREVRNQDYLEAVEERYRRSVPTDYQRSVKCGLDDRYLPVRATPCFIISFV